MSVHGNDLKLWDVVEDHVDNVRGVIVEVDDTDIQIQWTDHTEPTYHRKNRYFGFSLVSQMYDHDLADVE